MKVAIVNTLYAPRLYGGTERNVQIVADELVRRGHEVVVVAAAPRRKDVEHELNGVRVREVALANVYWPYRASDPPVVLESAFHVVDFFNPVMAGRVARIVREERPDVVHTNSTVGFSPLIWPAMARMTLPVVHTLHDHRLLCVHAAMYKHGRACLTRCTGCRLSSALKRRPANTVDVVTGVSQWLIDRHVEAGFFVDVPRVVIPAATSMASAPATRNVEGQPLRLGFLGRLHPGKGVELLLEATRDLPSDGWVLQIAGSGEEGFVRSLKAMQCHAKVSFVGQVDAPSFLADIDVLIFPSQLYEGDGLGISEAFALGIPVLASRRGPLPEKVRPGETGDLFDPDDPEELRALLRATIADPSRVLGSPESRAEEAARHRPDRVVEAYEKAYEQAIEEAGRPGRFGRG